MFLFIYLISLRSDVLAHLFLLLFFLVSLILSYFFVSFVFFGCLLVIAGGKLFGKSIKVEDRHDLLQRVSASSFLGMWRVGANSDQLYNLSCVIHPELIHLGTNSCKSNVWSQLWRNFPPFLSFYFFKKNHPVFNYETDLYVFLSVGGTREFR